jgi:CheY-like chemotaxis protein
MSPTTRRRVLIAGDGSYVRSGSVCEAPGAGVDVVGIVADGQALWENAPELKPDIIVLDVGMPLLNGLEAGRRIKSLVRSVKINISDDEQRYGHCWVQAGVTSTTPRMITTVRTVTGKVWNITTPNSVILTLEDGTNESFKIPKNQKFKVDGQEVDAWGVKKDMRISATKITETPENVVAQEVRRTGMMPPPWLRDRMSRY